MQEKICAIILTKNEEIHLGRVLKQISEQNFFFFKMANFFLHFRVTSKIASKICLALVMNVTELSKTNLNVLWIKSFKILDILVNAKQGFHLKISARKKSFLANGCRHN